tara:strand:+ start:363 stop:644 length:282 start_codon:yes stop_codon:yes gene_type:complete
MNKLKTNEIKFKKSYRGDYVAFGKNLSVFTIAGSEWNMTVPSGFYRLSINNRTILETTNLNEAKDRAKDFYMLNIESNQNWSNTVDELLSEVA